MIFFLTKYMLENSTTIIYYPKQSLIIYEHWLYMNENELNLLCCSRSLMLSTTMGCLSHKTFRLSTLARA